MVFKSGILGENKKKYSLRKKSVCTSYNKERWEKVEEKDKKEDK